MASSSRWKAQERLVAAELGGHRIPNNGFGQPDVDHPYFAIQVKTFKAMPVWLAKFWQQTSRDAEKLGKVPLLALCHAPGPGIKVQRYALLPLDELARLYEEAKSPLLLVEYDAGAA